MRYFLLIILCVVALTACVEGGLPTSPPGPPTAPESAPAIYTPDLVINAAKEAYPVVFKIDSLSSGNPPETAPTTISVTYLGTAVWEVTYAAPIGYTLGSTPSGNVREQVLYFYENNGKLYTFYNHEKRTLSNSTNILE